MDRPSTSTPVRVFIGTSAGGEDAEAAMVCAASLLRRASVPVEVALMALSRAPDSPYSGWQTDRWASPWTGLRWAVPALCDWSGRAIYFDAPTIVLGDVAELAAAPMPKGACVLMRRIGAQMRTECLVFDCAAAQKWLPPLDKLRADIGAHQTVGHILSTRAALVGDLPAGWSAQDPDYSRDPRSVTGSVYCASAATQPHQWYARGRLRKAGREHWFQGTRLPHYCKGLVDLFAAEYEVALKEGHAVEQYIPDEKYGSYWE
jgi:hypothetical protein